MGGEIARALPDETGADARDPARRRAHGGAPPRPGAPRAARPARGVLVAAALSIEMARLRVEVRLQLAEVEARARGSSRPDTRSAGGSSATCTTGPAAARLPRRPPPAPAARLPAGRKFSRPPSTRPWRRSERRSPTCARSQPACVPRGSTRDWPPRCGTSRARRPCRSTSTRPGAIAASIEAAAYFVACEALTNAVKHAILVARRGTRRPRERELG